jgi:hypothetical protein
MSATALERLNALPPPGVAELPSPFPPQAARQVAPSTPAVSRLSVFVMRVPIPFADERNHGVGVWNACFPTPQFRCRRARISPTTTLPSCPRTMKSGVTCLPVLDAAAEGVRVLTGNQRDEDCL